MTAIMTGFGICFRYIMTGRTLIFIAIKYLKWQIITSDNLKLKPNKKSMPGGLFIEDRKKIP